MKHCEDKMDIEKIKSNFEYYENVLLANTEDVDRKFKLKTLLKDHGERIALCPASTKEEYHNSYAGGLVDHSIAVLKNMYKLSMAYYPDKYTKQQIAFFALLHDLGKIGNLEQDLYIPNTDDYNLRRGNNYFINKNITYIPIGLRTIYLLQHYCITLTDEEFLTFSYQDNINNNSDSFSFFKQPQLSLLLYQADTMSIFNEKNKEKVENADN